jgi:hypothetical protein
MSKIESSRHWLLRGWWEVRDPFGVVTTAPTLSLMRTQLFMFNWGEPYVLIRRGSFRSLYRERARFARVVSLSGRVIMARIPSPVRRAKGAL